MANHISLLAVPFQSWPFQSRAPAATVTHEQNVIPLACVWAGVEPAQMKTPKRRATIHIAAWQDDAEIEPRDGWGGGAGTAALRVAPARVLLMASHNNTSSCCGDSCTPSAASTSSTAAAVTYPAGDIERGRGHSVRNVLTCGSAEPGDAGLWQKKPKNVNLKPRFGF